MNVQVYAERAGAEPGEHLKVAEGSFVYVHVNEDRQKVPVPPE